MYSSFCPKCKYVVYSSKRASMKDKYKFKCTCGCDFVLHSKFVRENDITAKDKKKDIN